MKRKVKIILISIIGVHLLLYILIGDLMLEHEVLSNFEIFNRRRLENEYNKDVSEKFYFASCGDEFFRNRRKLNEFIEEIHPSPDYRDTIKSLTYYRWVSPVDSSFDFADLNEKQTTESNDVTVVTFSICRLAKIPFLYTRIDQEETFSVHTDFHAMYHNEQIVSYDIHYVWLIFKWFKIIKINSRDYS